jgi:hypothetical protein
MDVAGIATPILIWVLLCFVVTIACAIAGVFLARMLKRRSKSATQH